MVWFVKGWVAHRNGHPNNQVIIVATTTKEKARCASIASKPKVKKLDVSEGSTQCSLEVVIIDDLPRMTLNKVANMFTTFMELKKHVPNEEVSKVETILELKHEIWKLNKLHLKQLEEEKNGYSERLISLKVNMDD